MLHEIEFSSFQRAMTESKQLKKSDKQAKLFIPFNMYYIETIKCFFANESQFPQIPVIHQSTRSAKPTTSWYEQFYNADNNTALKMNENVSV